MAGLYEIKVNQLPEVGSKTQELARNLDNLIEQREQLIKEINKEINHAKRRLREKIVTNWNAIERIKANLNNI